MSKHQPLALTLYRLLLYLYPPAFRRRFGPEILALFATLHADALHQSALSSLYVTVFLDLCISIPTAWWATLHQPTVRRWYAATAAVVMLFSLIYRII